MPTATTATASEAPQNSRRTQGLRRTGPAPRRSAFRAERPARERMRMMARARRVVGRMAMIVFAWCHALMGAPRPAHCGYSDAGRD